MVTAHAVFLFFFFSSLSLGIKRLALRRRLRMPCIIERENAYLTKERVIVQAVTHARIFYTSLCSVCFAGASAAALQAASYFMNGTVNKMGRSVRVCVFTAGCKPLPPLVVEVKSG